MIPIIGLIVATYTIFRFIETAFDFDAPPGMRFLAVVAAGLTGFLSIALLLSSATAPH